MPRFGRQVMVLAALVVAAAALGGAQSGASPPISKPSIAIKADMGTYRVGTGDTLTGELTITNLSDENLELCPWSDSCTVRVVDEKGEPPTTYRQRDAAHRLLPGEAPLERTLYNPWIIAPGKTDTHGWILNAFYDLSAPGKYTLHFEVQDPKTREVLRSNTVSFDIPVPVK